MNNQNAGSAAAPPGAEPAPQRIRLRYELLNCALHGHELLGPADAQATGHADLLHRTEGATGFGWLRCMRCDAWVPLRTVDMPPPRSGDDIVDATLTPPLRGRPLRDRFVLRLIAADRVVHFLALAAVTDAIFLFAHDRNRLRGGYTRILNKLQGALGGPLTESSNHGLLHEVNRLFTVPTSTLYLYGAGIAVYALVNGVEAVGVVAGPALGRVPDPDRGRRPITDRDSRTHHPSQRPQDPHPGPEPGRRRLSAVGTPTARYPWRRARRPGREGTRQRLGTPPAHHTLGSRYSVTDSGRHRRRRAITSSQRTITRGVARPSHQLQTTASAGGIFVAEPPHQLEDQ